MKVHRYAWEPFGVGVHKCLGMFFAGAAVTTIMHHPLMNYHALPFPKDGQPLNLKRRPALSIRTELWS